MRIFLILTLFCSSLYAKDDPYCSSTENLFEAARSNCPERIIELVKQGANVNAVDNISQSPLFAACKYTAAEAVQTLIDLNANVNLIDGFGRTPAFYIFYYWDTNSKLEKFKKIYDLVIAKIQNIKLLDNQKNSLMHFAVKSEPLFALDLKSRGLDINHVNMYGKNPLYESIDFKNLKTAEVLLNLGAKPDSDSKNSSLTLAIYNNFNDIIPLLIEMGANVNATNDDFSSPLNAAIKTENISVIQLLAKKGVDLNAKYYTDTPIKFSLSRNAYQVASLLLDLGSTTSELNYYYELSKILTEKNIALAKKLLRKKVIFPYRFVNKKDGREYPSIFSAIFEDDIELAELFISTEPNSIDDEDYLGNNGIFYVKSIAVAEYLIKKGVKINSLNIEGNNALAYIEDTSILEYLIQAGFNIKNKNKLGNSLLSSSKSKEKMLYLINKGLNVNELNNENENALFKIRDPLLLQFLISKGADPKLISNSGYTVLYNSDLSFSSKQILIENGADINYLTEKKCHFLFPKSYSSTELDAYEFSYYLNHGLNPNLRLRNCNDREIETIFPIFNLIHTYSNNVSLLQLLIDHSANPFELDSLGRNALFYLPPYWSSNTNPIETHFKFLVSLGLNPNQKDLNGDTALTNYFKWTSKYNDGPESGLDTLLTYLIKAGASVNEKTSLNQYPLIKILSPKSRMQNTFYSDIVNKLIWLGHANLKIKDDYGWTPFDLVISRFEGKTRYKMVKDFILAGYDINSKNPEGKAAIDIAREENDGELIELLLDQGVKP